MFPSTFVREGRYLKFYFNNPCNPIFIGKTVHIEVRVYSFVLHKMEKTVHILQKLHTILS
jgi:hypothetical protein